MSGRTGLALMGLSLLLLSGGCRRTDERGQAEGSPPPFVTAAEGGSDPLVRPPDAATSSRARDAASADGQAEEAKPRLDASGEAADSEPGLDASPPALPAPSAEESHGALVCPEPPYPSPLPESPHATRIGSGFGFVEGPVWLPALGVLLFSDMDFTASGSHGPPSTIRRLTPPNGFDVLLESVGVNGLALDRDGSVLAASHDLQSLSRIDPQTGAREPLELSFLGKRFNSPNDLVVRSDGNVYFTDPDWQLGPRRSQTGITGVYRLDPRGRVSLVDGELQRPNGITLSPDERTLYVGSAGAEVWAYPLGADGSVGLPRVFARPGPSDGMTVDCAGNLYVTAKGVQVFAPGGARLGAIAVDEAPTNVAFGGPERRTLYITARTGLYAIELNVPGRAD